jgi:excisionase family DNA binding protein
MGMASAPQLLRTSQAAARLGVTGTTLRLWVEQGRVPAVVTPTGQLRFRPEDIEKANTPYVPGGTAA